MASITSYISIIAIAAVVDLTISLKAITFVLMSSEQNTSTAIKEQKSKLEYR